MALYYIRYLDKDALIQGHLVRDLTEVSQQVCSYQREENILVRKK